MPQRCRQAGGGIKPIETLEHMMTDTKQNNPPIVELTDAALAQVAGGPPIKNIPRPPNGD
jgi:hypothetical protein